MGVSATHKRLGDMGYWLVLVCCLLFLPVDLCAAPAKQLKVSSASASSTLDKYVPQKAIDGIVSDPSRWVSEANTLPAWLELTIAGVASIGGLHIYSGYGNTDALEDFAVQYWTQGEWKEIPSAVVSGNKSVGLRLPFDQTVDVKTDRLRILITKSPRATARIKEVIVWSNEGDLPVLDPKTAQSKESHGNAVSPQEKIVPILLNQSGFNIGAPKRFTAPTLKNATPFTIRETKDKKQGSGAILFNGALHCLLYTSDAADE